MWTLLSRVVVVTAMVTASIGAQAELKKAHIGFLRAESPEPVFNSFRDGMRDLGYVEGRNLIIEQRWANGNYADLPRLAQELVDLRVDVIALGAAKSIVANSSVTGSNLDQM